MQKQSLYRYMYGHTYIPNEPALYSTSITMSWQRQNPSGAGREAVPCLTSEDADMNNISTKTW